MNKLKTLSLLLLLTSPLLCMQNDDACAGAGGYEGDGTDHIGKTKTIFGSKKKQENKDNSAKASQLELSKIPNRPLYMIFDQLAYIPKTLKDHKLFAEPIKIVTEKKILETWPELRAFMIEKLPDLVDNIISPDSTIEQILKWSTSPENKNTMNKALLLAAEEGIAKIVQILIHAGADINTTNQLGLTATIMAIQYSNPETLNVLLNAGADINIADRAGHTALSRAAQTGTFNPEIFKFLLSYKPTETNNAFMTAIRNYNIPAMEILLSYGTDVNAINRNRRTFLMTTILDRIHIEFVNFLLASGAKVNVADKRGKTPLMIAVEEDNIETFKVLLKTGADVNAVDKNGKTVLAYAIDADSPWTRVNEDHEVIKALLEAGADIPSNFMDYPEDIRTIIEQEAKSRKVKELFKQNKQTSKKSTSESQDQVDGAGGEPKDK